MMTNKIQTDPSDDTGSKQVSTRFKPGQSGNPAGRPKGARSRLGEQFIQAMADDFDENGAVVIRQVRTRDPTAYLKIMTSILPREVLVRAFNLNATVDIGAIEQAQGYLEAYRYARDRIGAPISHIEEGTLVTEAWRHHDDD